MIDVSNLRDRLRAEPFEPFVVETDDGQRVPVLRREWTLLTSGGWFFVATDRQVDGDDELFHLGRAEHQPRDRRRRCGGTHQGWPSDPPRMPT